MALSEQKFREIVFLLLYSFDFSKDMEEAAPLIMEELKVTKKSLKEASSRVESILAKLNEIDPLIAETSSSYDFQRIPRAEKNILRLGVFELLFDEAIPDKVAISEAIRLSRKFASFEAASFANAILDAIRIAKRPKLEDEPHGEASHLHRE